MNIMVNGCYLIPLIAVWRELPWWTTMATAIIGVGNIGGALARHRVARSSPPERQALSLSSVSAHRQPSSRPSPSRCTAGTVTRHRPARLFPPKSAQRAKGRC
jgi:hypothetical protein